MARLAAQVRVRHEREPIPSDGHDRRPDGDGRPLRPDVPQRRRARRPDDRHQANDPRRDPRAAGGARADPARPHDVRVGRELLRDSLDGLPRVAAIVADRGYRGLRALADRHNVPLDIKAPPKGQTGFRPIAPLYKIEHAFAQLGRWRRLSRCSEGSEASATAWLEVASVAYLLGRA